MKEPEANPQPVVARPSTEELAAAMNIYARKNRADLEERRTLLPQIEALSRMEGFVAIYEAAAKLRESSGSTRPFYDHLNAIATGMEYILSDITLTHSMLAQVDAEEAQKSSPEA